MDRLESLKTINKIKYDLKMRGVVKKLNMDNIFRNNLFATYQTLEHNGLYSLHVPSQQTSGLTPNIQAIGNSQLKIFIFMGILEPHNNSGPTLCKFKMSSMGPHDMFSFKFHEQRAQRTHTP